jgi:hypothetical protein
MSSLKTKPHLTDLQILNAILRLPDDKFFPPHNDKEKYRSMRDQLSLGSRRELTDRQRADAEAFYDANNLDKAPPPAPPSSTKARKRKGGGTPPSTPAGPLVLPPHPLDVHLRNLPKKPPGRT